MTTSTRTEAEQPPPLLESRTASTRQTSRPLAPARAARDRGSGLPAGRVGGWFADLAAGVDDTGQPGPLHRLPRTAEPASHRPWPDHLPRLPRAGSLHPAEPSMTTQAVDDAGAARRGDRITRADRPAGAARAGRGRPPRDEAAQQARLEDFHQRLSEQVLALSDGTHLEGVATDRGEVPRLLVQQHGLDLHATPRCGAGGRLPHLAVPGSAGPQGRAGHSDPRPSAATSGRRRA